MRIAFEYLVIVLIVLLPLANVSQAAKRVYRSGSSQRTAPTPNRTPTQERQSPRETSGSAVSRLSETQQRNLQQLQNDLVSLKEGSEVTQAQKESLKNSLLAIADGAVKPDANLVQQLANDLSDSLVDQNLNTQEKIKLANDLQKVMNSANIPKEEVDQAIADTQAILTASGISKEDLQTVVYDLKAITTEAQKNSQNAADKMTSQGSRLKKPVDRRN